MKIVINGLQIGNLSGTGRYTEELIRSITALQQPIEIYLIQRGKSYFDIHINKINLPNNKLFAYLLLPQTLRKLCNKIQPDLIHHPASYGYRIENIPYVLTVHDVAFMVNPDWFTTYQTWFYTSRIKNSMYEADQIITDSYFSANEIVKHFAIQPSKIEVIHLGVSDCFSPQPKETVQEIKSKYKLPNKYLLYYGTFEPRKNIHTLIHAWSKIAKHIECDLVLVGRKGWKTKPIFSTIENSPHRHRIHTPGFISDQDLPAVITGATAFTYLSFYEGFGLPPLEAMRCGTPVIASNIPSLSEILENKAIFVNPYSVEEVSEKIYNLLQNPDEQKKLAQYGLEHSKKFTWEKTALQTLGVYKKNIK